MKKVYFLLMLCFASITGFAQVVVTQSFDATTFPPTGWVASSATYPWTRVTSGSNPTCSPHSGAGMAYVYDYLSSATVTLTTPVIDWSGRGANTPYLTVWFYRDVSAYNTATYNGEGTTMYVNTSNTTTGATSLGYVPRRGGQATSGTYITGTSTTTTSGWYQYTLSIPATYAGATNYLIFSNTGKIGDNQYMDDITYTTYPSPQLTVSPTSLNFGLVQAGTTSATLSYTVSGLAFSSSTGNITLTAPAANYSISTTSSTGPWSSTVLVLYTSFSLAATPVYVQFNAPATTGTYTGTVTSSGGGVTTPPGVSVTGISAVNCATPTQPQTIAFSNITGITATATLTDTYTPTGYIAVASVGALTGTPVNTTTYAVGNTIGNGTVVGTSTTTTLNLSSLIANTSYTITIFPYSNSGTCFGPNYNTVNPLNATLQTCLAIPSPLTTSGIGATGFTMSWPAGAGVTNYTVDVSTNNTFTAPIYGSPFTIAPSASPSLTVSGLLSNTNYYYRVTANGGYCNSAPSATTTVTTGTGTSIVISSGYNYDVIANGANTVPGSTTIGAGGFDGGGWVYYSNDFFVANGGATAYPGLPVSGNFTSVATTGIPYQLASYSANNCLWMPAAAAGNTGTLTFANPVYASTVYVLGCTGSGGTTGAPVTLTATYTDNTTQSATVNYGDWYTGTPIARASIGRVGQTTNFDGTASGPNFDEKTLAVTSYTKQIKSLTVTTNGAGAGNVGIFGVSVRSGVLSVSTPTMTFPLTNSCVTSAAQIFSVSGVYLYPSNGNIIVTAPTGFLVSNGVSAYAQTATLTCTGNNLTNVPVYVEFAPGLSGGVTSGTITFSGGTVNNAPTVTVSGTLSGLSLSPANTVAAFGNISYQTMAPFPFIYNLSGIGLTPGNITVSVVSSIGTDFKVAPDNGTPTPYAASFNITAGATLATTPIYVQFTPSVMGAESATVTVSGGGQTCTQVINATGVGTVACSQPGAPTTLLFQNISATGSNMNFAANGSPTGYLLVQSTTAATPSISPANGFVYQPATAFGANATVVNNYNTVPALAVTGQNGNTKYYMNVYAYNGGPAGTCGSGPYYAPTSLSGSYITCPSSPLLATSNLSLNSFTLSWPSCAGGGATTVTYFVEVATDAAFTHPAANYPVVLPDNVGTIITNITGLSAGTAYYYRVTALGSCNSIAATGSIITSSLSYCTPNYYDGCGSWYASGIVGGGINFSATTGCGTPNQTSMVATVTAGGTLPLTVTTQQYTGCSIWVDWNNDGTFQDAENAYHSYSGGAPATYNPIVNIPVGQASGNYRMRVMAGWGSDGYASGGNSTLAQVSGGSTNGYGPCGYYDYETYEDFTVYIGSATSSFSALPSTLAFGSTQICNATTSQSVTISSSSLQPTVGTVYAFAPTGYQVSSTNAAGSWGNSASYAYTGGTISSTVYVRLNPNATGVDTGYVTFSGGGVAPMPRVAVSGTVTAGPSIQPITGTLNFCFASSVTSPLGDGLSGGNWASSNAAVATIDNSGNLTTHGIGTTLVTYASANCAAISSVTTTVNVYPVPTSSVTAASSNTISSTSDCNSVTLTANTDIGNYFTWYQNGTAITNDSTNTYIATTSGTYYVISKYSVTGCNTQSAPVVVTIFPHPTASIATPSNSTFACTSLPMTAVTDIGNQYNWTLNGSSIVSTTNTYTATTSGTYALTVTNSATGCFTTATMNVVIDPNPTTTVTGSGVPNQMVACGTLTLTASPATGNYFTWYQNGVQVQQGASNTYHAPISGTYYVNVMDVVGGCNGNSGNIIATVNELPTSVVSTQSSATTACGSLVLTGTSDIGTSFEWSRNGSPVSAANPYTATTSGTYVLNSSVSGTGCNTNSATLAVTINTVPTSIITTAGNATTACGELVLTASSNAGNNFTWYQNGSAVQQGSASSYIATATATYYVNSDNASSGCNTNSANKAITIYPLPLSTATPLGPTTICQGQSVVLEANTGGGLNYNWLQNNSSTGGTGIDYTANTTGSYSVVVKDANNCSDTSADVLVTVNPLPVPVITAVGQNLSTGTYSTYQWYLNGLPIPGSAATNATYTALLNGSYTVFVTDANGCSATSQAVVVSGLGVANVQGGNISIYPNPNNGSFTIAGTIQTTDNNIDMEITDVAGQVVMRTQFKANNGAINKMVNLDPVLAPGMYMVRLRSDQANLVWQFVKQ